MIVLYMWPPRLLAALAIACSIALQAHAAFAVSSKASEAAGALLFREKGCAYCHGTASQGTEKGPSLVSIRKTWKAPQIADQIENGGQKMPGFKGALSKDEVAQLVAYLRAKHRPLPPPIQTPPTVSNPGQ